MGGGRRPGAIVRVALALAGLALGGCALLPGASRPSYRFVEGASADVFAHAKISGWQMRERSAPDPPTAAPDTLGDSWERFVAAERRTMAERVAAWIQKEAEAHYLPDTAGDHWPTFAEVSGRREDDCDGFELLALQALRSLGFPEGRLYRAVLERAEDGMQHMVTLWFETPDDPLVIDPTGFATGPVRRLSGLAGWEPRALFTERVEVRAEGHALAPAGAPR